MAGSKLINVEIIGVDRMIYRGQVEALSGVNAKGEFDILADHARFISLLEGELIVHINKKTKRKIVFTQKGVIRCFDNVVKVYLQDGTMRYDVRDKSYGKASL